MASRTNFEHELKLGARLDMDLPDLRPVIGGTTRLPEQRLSTAYFDTDDLRLWSMGITLRHRTGADAPELWILKVPRDGQGRGPQGAELTWRGDRHEIPPEVFRVIRGITRHREVSERLELFTVRQRLTLRNTHGEAWAELDDDVVTVCEGVRNGERFRQLEMQSALLPDEQLLTDVIRTLEGAGAKLEQDQKFATALGIQTEISPFRARPDSSIAEVVQAAIDDCLRRLLQHDYLLRLAPSAPSEHDVHQARVATRRLRSNLKTLRSTLDPIWVRHTRAELHWLGDVLGAIRDADVLLSRLTSLKKAVDDPDGTAAQELRSRLILQRADASKALALILEEERYISLLDRLHAAAERPPLMTDDSRPDKKQGFSSPEVPAKELLPSLVRSPSRKLRKRMRKASSRPSDQALHRARIAAKELRYAAELAVPVVGRPASRTADGAKRLQTVLGEHHDAVAAAQWLKDAARDLSRPANFAAGTLAADQRVRMRRAGKEWKSAWKKVDRKKRRRWLSR